MATARVDEETPLLPDQKKSTPLPWGQFSLLIGLQLTEPLTNHVIYPFLPQVGHHSISYDAALLSVEAPYTAYPGCRHYSGR